MKSDKPQEPQLPSAQARKAANEMSRYIDSWFQLNRDWQTTIAAIIDKFTRAALSTPQPVRESLEKILQCFANGSTPDASVIQEAKDALTPNPSSTVGAEQAQRHSPGYVFREAEEPLAYQIWRSDESAGFIHESCATTPTEREFPLYADDLAAAQCGEPVYCENCDALVAEASDARSRAAEWIANYDETIAVVDSKIGRETKALYGKTRTLIADLLATPSGYTSGYAAAREEAAKVVDVCTCGSGPEFRPVNMRFHSNTCQKHLASLISALAATEETEGEGK